MLIDYYNLRQQPFGIAPDPQFLYMSRSHSEALASLWYGLREERGFMALAAPPGMGKTTLLFHLLGYLRDRARTVFLFQTQCDSRELFRYLLRDFGLTPGPDLAAMHEQLNQVMLQEARAGRKVIVVVDEAQDLADSVLETIRLLSDFETSQRKLLQIILAGQTQLVRTLMRPEMEQLRQRISLLSYLQPFNRQEVEEYIAHRLKIAGHRGEPLFTGGALEMIAQVSGGIPRNVNNLCFQALSIGCALRKKRISREIAEEALADQRFESLLGAESPLRPEVSQAPPMTVPAFQSLPQPRMRLAALTAAAVLIAGGLGAAYAARTHVSLLRALLAPKPAMTLSNTPVSPASSAPGPAAQPLPESDPLKTAAQEQELVVVGPHQTLTEISKLHLGEYNATVLAKLRELNPSLGDPNQLEVGQQIRLPVAAAGESSASGEREARETSGNSR